MRKKFISTIYNTQVSEYYPIQDNVINCKQTKIILCKKVTSVTTL